MSIELQYIIVVVLVAWLIGAGFIIIPRLIKKKTVSTNATNADIVKAIYSLKDTIYAAMAVQMCLTITMMAFMFAIIINMFGIIIK